eukprot:TRINITY_DN7851_c0_g1_i2.p1 TRINITY_DN7851_c0_g1~~TRINITY_DN7851_c0_g1_i2.p1  ORF type:complete len:253 (+),score=33.61 TRINITY_DN7851_c0_g1_i2:103-759(+)
MGTVLKKQPFWQPSEIQESAIRRCMAYCQRENEVWIKGWICVSVNEWGSEQERIILLNNCSYYRIKYDYDTSRILHFRRTPFVDIIRIEHGQFQVSSFSLSGALLKDKIQTTYGIRIFKRTPDGRQSVPNAIKALIDSVEPEKYKTYVPTLSHEDMTESARQVAYKELIEEIIGAFSAVTRSTGSFVFPFVNTRLEWENPGGLVSATYNSLQLGKTTI